MQAKNLPLHTPLRSRVGSRVKTFIFSEKDHVAYEIEGNEEVKNKQTNISILHTSLTWVILHFVGGYKFDKLALLRLDQIRY